MEKKPATTQSVCADTSKKRKHNSDNTAPKEYNIQELLAITTEAFDEATKPSTSFATPTQLADQADADANLATLLAIFAREDFKNRPRALISLCNAIDFEMLAETLRARAKHLRST